MSRTWCPAMASKPEALDGAVLTETSPHRARGPATEGSPAGSAAAAAASLAGKTKGATAASGSAAAFTNGSATKNRAAATAAFSRCVAFSHTAQQRMAELPVGGDPRTSAIPTANLPKAAGGPAAGETEDPPAAISAEAARPMVVIEAQSFDAARRAAEPITGIKPLPTEVLAAAQAELIAKAKKNNEEEPEVQLDDDGQPILTALQKVAAVLAEKQRLREEGKPDPTKPTDAPTGRVVALVVRGGTVETEEVFEACGGAPGAAVITEEETKEEEPADEEPEDEDEDDIEAMKARRERELAAERAAEEARLAAAAEAARITARVNAIGALELRGSLRGEKTAAAALSALAARPDGCPLLRTLDLSNNAQVLGGIGEGGNAEAVESLGRFVQEAKGLKTLNVAQCGLNGAAVQATLVPALLTNGTVESLDFENNGIGLDEDAPAAVEALSQLFRENKFLRHVSLAHNDLAPQAIEQFAEAFSVSETRAMTPEPEAEPEPEVYEDELPEANEAPEQEIGYPEDLEAARIAAEEAAEAARLAEEREERGDLDEDHPQTSDAFSPDEPEPEPEAPAHEEGEEAEEGEEEEDGEGNAEEEAAHEEHEEEDEEDPEEKEERLREEYEAAEAEWRERTEEFIWTPERAHFEHKEHLARRSDVMQLHIDETTALKEMETAARHVAKEQQLHREANERTRRSGWSHLESLSLRGNAIGSVGAAALAKAIVFDVPLPPPDEDELAAEAAAAEEEEEDEEEEAAPDARKEEDEFPTGPGGGDADADHDHDDEEGEEGEEVPTRDADDAVEEEEEAPKKPKKKKKKAPRPPRPTSKPGFRTLAHLDLSECKIPSKGMKALAATIATNCPQLKTLLLRKNTFAVKKRPAMTLAEGYIPQERKDEEEEEEIDEHEELATRPKVPDEKFESPGFAAFAQAIAQNSTLQVLDLSQNGMYPPAAAQLVVALRAVRLNQPGAEPAAGLAALYLDENPLGHDAPDATVAAGAATLANLVDAVSVLPALKTLGLSGVVGLSTWAAHCVAESCEGRSSATDAAAVATPTFKKEAVPLPLPTDAPLFSTVMRRLCRFGLTSLDLSNCALGNDGLKALSLGLENTPDVSLTRLMLGGNSFSGNRVATCALVAVIAACRAIEEFGIGENPDLGTSTPKEVRAMTPPRARMAVDSASAQPTVAAPSATNESEEVQECLIRVFEVLSTRSSLRRLHAAKVGLATPQPVLALLGAASSPTPVSKTMETLDLRDCALPASAMDAVVASTAACSKLRRFSLWTRTGDAAAVALPLVVMHAHGGRFSALEFTDFGVAEAKGLDDSRVVLTEANPYADSVEELEGLMLKNRIAASLTA